MVQIGSVKRGRPKGDTRERILEVALRLFVDPGYDRTSLREIAEELGITKAALYYHFERKEDILLALHNQLHELASGLFDGMAELTDGDEGRWLDFVDRLIVEVAAHRDLFAVHLRNGEALEALHIQGHDQLHEHLDLQFKRLLSDRAVPLASRVRMAASLAATMGPLMAFADSFSDTAPEELATEVRRAIGRMFGRAPAGPTAPAE